MSRVFSEADPLWAFNKNKSTKTKLTPHISEKGKKQKHPHLNRGQLSSTVRTCLQPQWASVLEHNGAFLGLKKSCRSRNAGPA